MQPHSLYTHSIIDAIQERLSTTTYTPDTETVIGKALSLYYDLLRYQAWGYSINITNSAGHAMTLDLEIMREQPWA